MASGGAACSTLGSQPHIGEDRRGLTRTWFGKHYPWFEAHEVADVFAKDAMFALYAGEIDEGAALIRRMLPEARGYYKGAFYHFRWSPSEILMEHDPDAAADPRMVELAADILACESGNKRLIKEVRQAKTNGELAELLNPRIRELYTSKPEDL
jgi:hypothetical protein